MDLGPHHYRSVVVGSVELIRYCLANRRLVLEDNMSASAAKTSQPVDGNSVADIFERMSYGPAPEAEDVAQVGPCPCGLY